MHFYHFYASLCISTISTYAFLPMTLPHVSVTGLLANASTVSSLVLDHTSAATW